MALMALACTTGCGAGGGDVKLVAASRPDTALVAGVPEPFDPAGRQAPNTFVGKIGPAGWAYVAVVTRGRRALIYLCDGRASEWFGASIRGGRLLVRSFNGTVVDARVQAGHVRGTVQPRGQSAGAFLAVRPSGPGIGLFQGPDPAVPRHIRRWIVLADGVRGVSDPPLADVVSGSGTATKGTTTSTAAPTTTTSTAPPTTTQPPAADAGAGSGHATRATTTAATPPTTVRTVTTPTTTTTRATTAPPSPSAISDGTSNTIIIGETSTPPPGDGSVRTIGSPTTPATTQTTTTPAATLTTTTRSTTAPQSLSAVSDGTSNTIIIGATTTTTTTTTPPPATTTAPATTITTATTSSSISDGTSNTIVLGVDPINGIAAGASPPPIAPAPPVTTCPVLAPCPPALPAFITATSGAKTIGQTPGGQPNLLPGGGLIDCRTLTALIASLAAAAKQGDAAAIKQLGVLLAQAKANRC